MAKKFSTSASHVISQMAQTPSQTRTAIQIAAQALKKNHAILVLTGSGMLADSGVEPLRGTVGMWQQYPILKKEGYFFEHMVHSQLFQQNPNKFWYLFGSLYNQYQEAEPHEGYEDLLNILNTCKPNKNWFLYHEGTDLLYEKAGFPKEKVMQGKGNIFYWQCKPCNIIERQATYKFRLDHEQGLAKSIPVCSKCKKPVRPNINLKEDIGWLDSRAVQQDELFSEWFSANRNRSMTVLEIGAGPVQPIAREISDNLIKSDKYRCALIRINPVRERTSQYKWEQEQIIKLMKDQTNDQGELVNADFEVPDFIHRDMSSIVKEEEKELKALKNQLVEIQLGAKDGLRMIKDELIK